MVRNFIYVLIGAGLSACSSVTEIHSSAERIEVNETYSDVNRIDSIVQPYRSELADEMQEEIAYAEHDYLKGRPNGWLNNWAADAALWSVDHEELDGPVMSLLNVGGLRNPISMGAVTLGDMYKLMPFDNELVIAKMPWSSITDIEDYLIQRNGEPIGGTLMLGGKLEIGEQAGEYPNGFYIVTSDYLLNGGDNMSFFEKRSEVIHTGMLLRDAFIKEAKRQKTLDWKDNNRIQF